MATKKTLVKTEEEGNVLPKKTSDLVRVEDSVEDFLSTMLPAVAGAVIDVRPLFTAKDGASYFRCNYWKYWTNDVLPSRKMVDSRYVKVERQGGVKKFTDLTVVR